MKIHRILILAVVALAVTPFTLALAHNETASQITQAQEVALGNALLAKVQSGERSCASLSDDDFILLGSHFMDVALGDTHDTIEAKLGTVLTSDAAMDGLHVLMGKNGVHCDSAVVGAATATSEGNEIAQLSPRDRITKALLWLFALYGAWSLGKRLMPKKTT